MRIKRRLFLLLVRQHHCCNWCGMRMASPHHADHPRRATIDHVVPRSKGGTDTRDNRVAACFTCNQYKGDKLPAEWSPALPPHARAVRAHAAGDMLSAELRG